MGAANKDSADAQHAAGAWFEAAALEPLGNGHIHRTYLLRPDGNSVERYVLQKINGHVYGDIPLLVEQTSQVLAALAADAVFCAIYQVPELIPTRSGELISMIASDDEHQVWRLWRFVEDSMTCDPPTNRQQIRAAARAFGGYQRAIAVLERASLVETISGFLDMASYLDAFDATLGRTELCEREAAAQWIARVRQNREWPESLMQRNAVIHGDCKINNLLFDRQGERVLSVIDLDNNMMGHWAWDFGDLVRSISYSRGGFDRLDYQACVEGFLAGRGDRPDQDERLVEYLITAPAFLAFMLGLRFLTDHLAGDEYFVVSKHGDNLQRAIEQFELFDQFQCNEDSMRACARIALDQLTTLTQSF